MLTDMKEEARRQAEICNACRYCEGYCSVFPSLHSNREFSDGDIIQLANLCHNCRGCYYACQYTAPHEFDLNLPAALAEVRHDSWEAFAYPRFVATHFQKNGMAIALVTSLCFTAFFIVTQWLGRGNGKGFYAFMSHDLMVLIFAPTFVLPLASLTVSLRQYWLAVDGTRIKLIHIYNALGAAAAMHNLAGGHGGGCNFEDEDRFTQARRVSHQLVLYGFVLCFASTSSGTILHYIFDLPAPHGFFSLPKLLGVPGGLMLTWGAIWIFRLKLKADPNLGSISARSGEFGFIALLGFVAASGLVLYILGQTTLMPLTLAAHLGAVLTFFLLTPYTKMVHGIYRFAALVRDEQRKTGSTSP